MKAVSSIGAVCALVPAVLAGATVQKRADLPSVYVDGNAFMVNGERFLIRGVDYQPGGSSANIDPIANPTTCKRDIAYFKQLGINTIRVYSVDNTANHDECMSALADAGIYLALDVNNSQYSINRADPKPSYNDVYLQSVFATIDAFQGYSNTLLFFSGNEVINDAKTTDCAPYIKAVTRDMKNYILSMGYRHIMVGYSAADVVQNRYQTAQYMNCGPDAMARSDFFAFNDYEWCGDNTFVGSGWSQNVQTFSNYSIPLFLSETGCIKVQPRNFEEIAAIYKPEMTAVYSGALVYEYSEEESNPGYGIVNINGPNSASPKNPEYNNLKQIYENNPLPKNAPYHKDLPYFAECPQKSPMWNVNLGDGLPAIPAPALKYMRNGAGSGPGLNGPGSQTAGTESDAIVTSVNNGADYASSSGAGSSPTDNSAVSAMRPLEFQTGAIVSIAAVLLSSVLGAALL